MIDILKFRLGYGRQTVAFPDGPPRFPARFRGRPVVDAARAGESAGTAAEICPTEAIVDAGKPSMAIDLGRCTFCGACERAFPPGAIRFTNDHRLAARTREDLLVAKDEPVLAAAQSPQKRHRPRSMASPGPPASRIASVGQTSAHAAQPGGQRAASTAGRPRKREGNRGGPSGNATVWRP